MTKIVISPEAVVDVVDAFPGDKESSDEEEVENETHSNNNMITRRSLTRQCKNEGYSRTISQRGWENSQRW